MTDDDPRVIRSLVVSADDVVRALAYNCQGDGEAVLRVTPPFHGRMRARLHVVGSGYDSEPEPIHVDPDALVDGALAPPFPRADDTWARLKSAGSDDGDEERSESATGYSVERHYEEHVESVAEWRAGVRSAIVDRVTLDTPAGPREVSVTALDA